MNSSKSNEILKSIDTCLSNDVYIGVTECNTSLSTISTSLININNDTSNLATETTLNSIDTTLDGTLSVQSNSQNIATETTLNSIDTTLGGTLSVQSNLTNYLLTAETQTQKSKYKTDIIEFRKEITKLCFFSTFRIFALRGEQTG